jgi:DNA replication regulator DPB11
MDLVKNNGAEYSGDLTKAITHLVASEPKGQKYKFAKDWGIRLVSHEWIRDSTERGMILEEQLYHPEIPQEKRGVNAWIRRQIVRSPLGKRARDLNSSVLEEGKRKLRRTASSKLTSQNANMWGEIVGGTDSKEKIGVETAQAIARAERIVRMDGSCDQIPPIIPTEMPALAQRGTFTGCRFHILGFEKKKAKILCQHLRSHDAEISNGEDMESQSPVNSFMVVPHDFPLDDLPIVPETTTVVTEWWVERCLEKNEFLSPSPQMLDVPFTNLSIERFSELTICSTSFQGIELLHLSKVVALMGAKYSESFSQETSILILNATQKVRMEKLQLAKEWRIPVVSINWLLDSIHLGKRQSYKEYIMRRKIDKSRPAPTNTEPASSVKVELAEQDDMGLLPSAAPTKPVPRSSRPWKLDESAFRDDDAESTIQNPTGDNQPQPRKRPRRASFDTGAFRDDTPPTVAFRDEDAESKVPNPIDTNRPQPRKPIRLPKFDTRAFRDDTPPPPAPIAETTAFPFDQDESTSTFAATTPLTKPIPLPTEPLREISPNSPKKPSPKAPQPKAIHKPPPQTEEISNAITTLLATKQALTSNLDTEPTDTTQTRRKRNQNRILGRARSDLSTVSRASSVDSTASHGQAVVWPKLAPHPLGKIGETLSGSRSSGSSAGAGSASIDSQLLRDLSAEGAGGLGKGSAGGGVGEDSQPPLTQMQYEDDEGKDVKARIQARMMGTKVVKRERERCLTVGGLDEVGLGRRQTRGSRGAGLR